MKKDVIVSFRKKDGGKVNYRATKVVRKPSKVKFKRRKDMKEFERAFFGGSQRYLFRPTIKNKNCKHKWTKLKLSFSKVWLFFLLSAKLEMEYLICEKCGSIIAEEVTQ